MSLMQSAQEQVLLGSYAKLVMATEVQCPLADSEHRTHIEQVNRFFRTPSHQFIQPLYQRRMIALGNAGLYQPADGKTVERSLRQGGIERSRHAGICNDVG